MTKGWKIVLSLFGRAIDEPGASRILEDAREHQINLLSKSRFQIISITLGDRGAKDSRRSVKLACGPRLFLFNLGRFIVNLVPSNIEIHPFIIETVLEHKNVSQTGRARVSR